MLTAIAAPAPRIGLPGSSSSDVVAAAGVTAAGGAGTDAPPLRADCVDPLAGISVSDGSRYASTTAWTCVEVAAAAATLGACD